MTKIWENAMLADTDSGSNPRGYGVPQEAAERRRLRTAARQYVLQKDLVPPLPLWEIKRHAAAVAGITGSPDEYADFITVVVGNALWQATVASVPYERRVLLLPQCLRDVDRCQGELDEFGLLCAQCGSCPVGGLQAEAEALGYVVLVAEGTTIVTTLLDQGKVDTVIGLSCLSVLERAFPHMAADAIPGIAIPLLRDGCIDTVVDVEWVREAIHLTSNGPWRGWLDIEALRADVASLFEPDRLHSLMGADGSQTEQIGLYFASLWYSEELYPLVFTVSALGGVLANAAF
ncbi:MAG: DUF116 domain-containing protein [Planctomycetes bacterium]|nr:DUF116 domain-containing protein [Planctomycetota bacterium]